MIVTDQTGFVLEIKESPLRIISLVPSQSELLWELGLKDRLKGITKFCIHPNEMFLTIDRVGGTKQLNLEKIRTLNPDLIIGNKEENDKQQIEELRKEFQVWMSDIFNLEDALQMITELGKITGTESKSMQITETIRTSFQKLPNPKLKGKRVAYLMWYNPIMAAANDTFIHSMLLKCGLTNVFEDEMRYPVITEDVLKSKQPDYLFLSTEPFPFTQKHINEFKALLPFTKVILIDGEMFSWYGSRLQFAMNYFLSLQ